MVCIWPFIIEFTHSKIEFTHSKHHCYKKERYTKINGINLSIRITEEKYFCLDIFEKKIIILSDLNNTEAWLSFICPSEAFQANNARYSCSFTPNWIIDLNQMYTCFIVYCWSIDCCLGDLNNIHFFFHHGRN